MKKIYLLLLPAILCFASATMAQRSADALVGEYECVTQGVAMTLGIAKGNGTLDLAFCKDFLRADCGTYIAHDELVDGRLLMAAGGEGGIEWPDMKIRVVEKEGIVRLYFSLDNGIDAEFVRH